MNTILFGSRLTNQTEIFKMTFCYHFTLFSLQPTSRTNNNDMK